MSKINYSLIVFLFLCARTIFAADVNSPVGYWKTIDDMTGQAKSIVQIEKSPNQILSGKVVSLFKNRDKICTECTGSRKNQPILGMVIMEGLKPSTDTANLWNQGEIMDPKNGKQYHCNIQLMENGKKLQVRGFLGIPLFGRSQTWIRVVEPA